MLPRRQPSTRAPTKSTTKAQPISPNDLAKDFARKLNISDSKGKGKEININAGEEESQDMSVDDRCVLAMRAINAASKELSGVIESGWRVSDGNPKGGFTKDGVLGLAKTARRSLMALRQLKQGEIDIERAASSVVGKLITLEMYHSALDLLNDMHSPLVGLYDQVPLLAQSDSHRLHLLALPLPPSCLARDVMLTLISTFLLNSLTAVSYALLSPILPPKPSSSAKAGRLIAQSRSKSSATYSSTQYPQDFVVRQLATTLLDTNTPTLLSWLPQLASLPSKSLDSVLTKAYTALSKVSSLYASSQVSAVPSAKPIAEVPFAQRSETVYQIRIYALFLLAHTSTGVLEPGMFWDQVLKFTGAFFETPPVSNTDDEVSRSKLVLKYFDNLVNHVETRDNRANFLDGAGQGFSRFVDCWMSVARKVGDVHALERIAVLVQSPSVPDSTSGSSELASSMSDFQKPPGESKSNISRKFKTDASEATKLCALFTQATALLEQDAESDSSCMENTAHAVRKARAFIIVFYSKDEGVVEEDRRAAQKICRALERLRRASVKSLEGSLSTKRKSCVYDILEKTVAVFQAVTQETRIAVSDVMTPALETLFTLARTTLNVADSHTYDHAFELLTRATELLSSSFASAHDIPSSDSSEWTSTQANYLRVISSAFYTLAGTLYQAGRWAFAVRFLDKACELGRKSSKVHKDLTRITPSNEPLEDKDVKEKGTWTTFDDGLFKRWEILGVCHSKTGDRKAAHSAFLQAILSYPFSSPSFLSLLATSSSSSTIFSPPQHKAIGNLIDRVTYTGCSDLFLDPMTISLKQQFDHVRSSEETSEESVQWNLIVGAILQRQIASLESIRSKLTVRTLTGRLLQDELDVYAPDVAPIRRARVFINILEFGYFNGGDLSGFSVNDVAMEVKKLLSRTDLGRDNSFAQMRPQYLIALHLWLALHTHRTGDTSQFSHIKEHSEEACKILKDVLAANPIPRKSLPRLSVGKPSARTPPKSKLRSPVARRAVIKSPPAPVKKRAVGRSATSSTRTTRAPPRLVKTARAEVVPVTPKPRKAADALSSTVYDLAPSNASLNAPLASMPDNLVQMVDLLRMVAQLLGFLGHVIIQVRLLGVTRRLCERYAEFIPEEYVQTSIDLAHEYVKLGKTERASNIYTHILSTVKNNTAISEETRVIYYLRYSELLATVDNVLKSSSVYCEALAMSDSMQVGEKGLSTIQKARVRVGLLERAAIAANTFAVIQYSRDDPSASVRGLLQALRLYNRAADSLARLIPPPQSKSAPESETSNPFEMSSVKDALPTDTQSSTEEPPRKSYPSRNSLSSQEFRIVSSLLDVLFALTQAYFARGSPREAEYFASQARDLAESLNAPAMVSRALTRIGEIQLHLGRLPESRDALMRAADLVGNVLGPEAADLRRLKAEISELSEESGDARVLYEEAMGILEQLEELFVEDGAFHGSRKSMGLSPKSPRIQPRHDALAPSLLVAVLRQNICLLHDAGEEYKSLLERLRALPVTPETKTEETALMAKITLSDAYARFRADMFLSSLAESTITLPIGMTGDKFIASATTQEILGTLYTAEKLFWSDLGIVARRGTVPHVRDATNSLALIRAFQASLGQSGGEGPMLAARLLDLSAAITLRREILEAVQHKFLDVETYDELQWPLITNNGSVLPPPISTRTHARMRLNSLDSDGDFLDEDTTDNTEMKKYWEFIAARYQSQVWDASTLSAPQVDTLPLNWTVVSITLTSDHNTLFISRQRPQHEPLIFCVPLKGRRESDDDEHLTFDDAIRELKEIIRLSDDGTKEAVNVKKDDRGARARWWAERGELDRRLKELLENIEFCWLGAFKTILSEPVAFHPDTLSAFRAQLEKILRRSLVTQQDKKQKSHVRLSDSLLECFASLSSTCKDEEIEDLIYFILDLYQFHGVPVATAEVDIDHAIVDLRNALEEISVKGQGRSAPTEDSHTFLVLDKNVQGIPWESIPMLRGRSVSRIPSMDFLIDRVHLARWQRGLHVEDCNVKVDRVLVDPHNAYFILNPSGDLKNTEARFSSWCKEMQKSAGWEGIVGRPPSEQQLADALTRKDLVIYFGHGGAEQYIRSHKIRHLPRCAVTMLFGCSSGALREMGEFDRVGTPYNYMVAGCPTLVANLWDVTDRDIDKFSLAVFDTMHLNPNSIRKQSSRKPGSESGRSDEGETSIVAAVAEARDQCKLKYLTGAAPVVYGIPFYL